MVDIGFELEPNVDEEAWTFESDQDIMELIEDGVLGYPEEYGYEDWETFSRDVQDFLGYGELDDIRREERAEKWRPFEEHYQEAGKVLYDPENGDRYYTDDERVL